MHQTSWVHRHLQACNFVFDPGWRRLRRQWCIHQLFAGRFQDDGAYRKWRVNLHRRHDGAPHHVQDATPSMAPAGPGQVEHWDILPGPHAQLTQAPSARRQAVARRRRSRRSSRNSRACSSSTRAGAPGDAEVASSRVIFHTSSNNKIVWSIGLGHLAHSPATNTPHTKTPSRNNKNT